MMKLTSCAARCSCVGWFGVITFLCTTALAQSEGEPAAAAVQAPSETTAPAGVQAQATALQAPAGAVVHQHGHPAELAGQEAGHEHGAAPATHEHDAHASSGHGSGHGSEAPPTFDDINWFYGFLGESDEVEPSLLWRRKGMSVPFVSTLINWGMLIGLIAMLAKKQLPVALAKRKASIVQGMDEAKKLRDESARRLREYEDKLAKIDSDIERIKSEMKQAGEQERDRILAEAVERRTRMERDARRMIETELEAAKESLRREVVAVALSEAKKRIEAQVAGPDQQRLFDEAMASLKKLPAKSLGGQA